MAKATNPTQWLRQHLESYATDPKQWTTQKSCYEFKKWSQSILEQWGKDAGNVENLPTISREIAETFRDMVISTLSNKARRMPSHDGDKPGAVVGYMLWMLKALRDEFDGWLPNGITMMNSSPAPVSGAGSSSIKADELADGDPLPGASSGGLASFGFSPAMASIGGFSGKPSVDTQAICKEALAETIGTTLSRWVGTAEDMVSLTKDIGAKDSAEWATEALKVLSKGPLAKDAARDGESMAHYLTRTSERMKCIDEEGRDPEKPFKNWIVVRLESMAVTADVATITAQWMQNGSSPEGSPYKAWIAIENENRDMKEVKEKLGSEDLSDLLEIHYEKMSKGLDKFLGEYRDFMREVRDSFKASETFRKNFARWNYSVNWGTPRDHCIADYKKALTEGKERLAELGAKMDEVFEAGKSRQVVTKDQVTSVSKMFEKTQPVIQEAMDAVEGKK